MTRGVVTPTEKQTEFAAAYLRLGNASAAAREIDLPETTGRDLARELEADEEFVAARREQRARALDRVMDASMGLIDVSANRVHQNGPMATEMGYSDIGAGYVRAVADLGRTIERLERLRLEREGSVAPAREVKIVVSALGKKPDGDSSD